MAPRQNPRILKAFHAMKAYGFSEDVVKPVLKNLFRVFDKNWEFIEDENYRVLIDAIFEAEEEKNRKATDSDVLHKPEHPLKKQRPNHEDQDLFSIVIGNGASSGTSLQGANLNSDTAVADIDPQPLQAVMEPSKPLMGIINPMDESEPDSPPTSLRLRDRRHTSSKALVIAEASDSPQLWKTNEASFISQVGLEDQSNKNISPRHPCDEKRTYSECSPHLLDSKEAEMDPQIIPKVVTDSFTFISPKAAPVSEISTGELAITVFPAGAQSVSNGQDTEERFIREENSENDAAKEVIKPDNITLTAPCNSDNGVPDAVSLLPENVSILASTDGNFPIIHHEESVITDNLSGNANKKKALVEGTGKSVSVDTNNLRQSCTNEMTYMLDAADITKGEENVKVSIVNHYNDVPLPSFCYIRQSLVGENAVVNISLARIGNEDCCQKCVGDCLSLKEPCICACATEERCGYASDGILNDKFLEQNISMAHNPQKQRQFFCENCPLEVGVDKDALKPCQGHLVRKIVKECWLKCTCSHNCTNRQVQRGINYKLQVFMTLGGKGWGLRTLVDLPKGAFVCEYVGEILTLSEHYLRYQTTLRHCAYTMILDAGWASSKEIKDDKDKPLCLDASVYGNVARFINHRCTDANLVAIPVRVETSDHLYHRVAFFTSRKVAALEELTRDYGTNFDDIDCVTKPFRCRCGSSFCRSIKRYNRKRLKEKNSEAFDFQGEPLAPLGEII